MLGHRVIRREVGVTLGCRRRKTCFGRNGVSGKPCSVTNRKLDQVSKPECSLQPQTTMPQPGNPKLLLHSYDSASSTWMRSPGRPSRLTISAPPIYTSDPEHSVTSRMLYPHSPNGLNTRFKSRMVCQSADDNTHRGDHFPQADFPLPIWPTSSKPRLR